MATPKFKKSRANTHARRSQWKADNVALQEVTIDGQTVRIPRRLVKAAKLGLVDVCLLYTSPSPRDVEESRMPSSA